MVTRPGKRLHNELGNPPIKIMGKSTISTGPFSIAFCKRLPGPQSGSLLEASSQSLRFYLFLWGPKFCWQARSPCFSMFPKRGFFSPDPSYFRFGFSLIFPEVLFWWIAILCRAPWTPLLLDDSPGPKTGDGCWHWDDPN